MITTMAAAEHYEHFTVWEALTDEQREVAKRAILGDPKPLGSGDPSDLRRLVNDGLIVHGTDGWSATEKADKCRYAYVVEEAARKLDALDKGDFV